MLKNFYARWQAWRQKRLFRYSFDLIVLLLFFIAIRAYSQREMLTGVAPDIQAITLQGQSFHLQNTAKRPLLLHFWASWCPICSLEQDSIEALSKDFNVITVAMQSGDEEEVRQFMRENNLSFAVINDPLGVISQRYGLRGVPASFILDEKNRIRFAETGYTTGLGLRVRLWLAR